MKWYIYVLIVVVIILGLFSPYAFLVWITGIIFALYTGFRYLIFRGRQAGGGENV